MSIKIIQSIQIKSSPEIVFDYTQDYNNRLKWDTFLIEARLIDGAIESAKGVKAWCVAHNGIGMETEYVSFNRPKVTAVKMTKGPYLFKSFAGSWQFDRKGENATLVTFTYSFNLRFPYIFASWFIKRSLDKNVQQRLIDLKSCIEKSNK
jgi:ribosome-associated toxin RatA of RatAB toxin-antitoxin module